MPGWLRALGALAPTTIWSSPLQRCRIPAEALSACLGVPVVLDPRLLELDFGDWEGRDWDRVPRAALDRWAADPLGFAPPRGEEGRALVARLYAVCADLAALEASWLVVSHGGPLRMMAAMLRDEPPDPLAPAPPMGAVRMVPTPRGATRRRQAAGSSG